MDDFGRIFRGFFGYPRGKKDDLQKEGLQDDQEENEENEGFGIFFGNRDSENDLEGMFEHFHNDMFRQMESLHRQMDEMLRGFGGVQFPPDFHPSRQEDPSMLPRDSPMEDKPRDGDVKIWFGTPSPFFHPWRGAEKKSPREFMLKEDRPDTDEREIVRPALPAPSDPSQDRSHKPSKPFFSFPRLPQFKVPEKKEDTDLDGKLSDKEVLDLITKKQTDAVPQSPIVAPSPSGPRMSSWGKSVSITRTQGPDGKMEEKRVVRDSTGHEERVVRKSMGDQSYTVTTVTSDDGRTETNESYQNMDEKDVSTFEKQWRTPLGGQPQRHPADSLIAPQPPVQIETQDKDLFSKLFGWRDK